MQAVFDGHNDVLLRLWQHARGGSDPIAEFIEGTDKGHIDMPRAKAGGLAGGLCAIYIPSGDLVLRTPDKNGHYVTPLSVPLDRMPSLATAIELADIATRLDRAGAWRLCRSTAEIREAMADGIFAAVLHMEGCEAIGPDLAALETFHAAGLRSLGPVWSRHNVFGHGVPFAYPSSPDTGPGLTEAGFELIQACNRLGILIDLAHITEKGFWDVAETTDQPLVASHSNAHALTPVARNLTDRQLDAIRESRGLVGLNYATTMLRADGQENAATPLSDMVRHIDYMVERVGIDCVALGSDFDGATIPEEIADAAGNQKLVAALKSAGYGDRELEKICRGNWLRVLGQAWHEAA
ncbi:MULTISPECIES: dipeptidase [Sinorhizobium]|uniref:Peptidase n=1 Tax=Sinorhizobium americanum TaxID=194963 RepID=A0A2S3YM44_9HYPH|nr:MULTISPECIES: dipeptidase [Sinorhizobium]PDT42216.1 peptidase [Sinorhizobium sp. FG01]POH30133.1 peptidase [Sinorhizobium americanum]